MTMLPQGSGTGLSPGPWGQWAVLAPPTHSPRWGALLNWPSLLTEHTARARLQGLESDAQQDKCRIPQAAERDITGNNLMELIKGKFQCNIVTLSSVSPALVRLVQLCNNHPGEQMKFCHKKNGIIIWHIIQMYTFCKSSVLPGRTNQLFSRSGPISYQHLFSEIRRAVLPYIWQLDIEFLWGLMSTYKTPPLKSHRDFDSAIIWHENFQIGDRKLKHIMGISDYFLLKYLYDSVMYAIWPDAYDNSMPVVEGTQSAPLWRKRHVKKKYWNVACFKCKAVSRKKNAASHFKVFYLWAEFFAL